MVEHTKGPWEVVALNRLGPFAIRMAYTEDQTFYGINTVHREPDAHLIAAAPELLDDAIEAERVFRWYGDLHAAKPDPDKAARNYALADRLAATIAKASMTTPSKGRAE